MDAPDFDEVRDGLEPGVYDARYLDAPGGPDCRFLLVRADGSLGWCYADGEQSEDHHGSASRFSVADLCEES